MSFQLLSTQMARLKRNVMQQLRQLGDDRVQRVSPCLKDVETLAGTSLALLRCT
jgi:hypothetical protein